uniref:Uncharacterized protein n=1 Tax=Streptomyces sp. NBC_00049 TaxID=2903617 RepID=A0AAU2JPE4_9ACTN
MKSEVGECLPLADGSDPVAALITDFRERSLESGTSHRIRCSLNACFDLRNRDDAQVEHSCGSDLDPAVVCRECRAEVTPGSLTPRFQGGGWTAAGPEA